MTIRAVIFDIGGVFNRVGHIGAGDRWQQRTGLDDRALAYAIFDGPLTLAASLGQATIGQIWASVAQQLGLSSDEVAELEADAWAAYVWNTELLDYVRSLRSVCKTATLSDAWPNARQQCLPYISEQAFDVMVYSAEEGIKKPDPEIFRRTLARLDVPPHEAIFVDDRQKNVDAAISVGMLGVLFTSNASARHQINLLLSLAP
jgi:HAD superfamily hydrolase (TIGR01509 family)